MKKLTGFAFAMVIATAVGAAGTGFAQSASESMKAAGTDIEHAASNAYHGTKTAVKDSDVTAKVKMALHDDKVTQGKDIHVSTTEGIVTLRGTVPSSEVAERAKKDALNTTGVRGVHDHLKIANSAG